MSASRRTIIIFADQARRDVAETLTQLRSGLEAHCTIADVLSVDGDTLPDSLAAGIDFAVVIGGDGTIIHQARRFVDHDIPIVGVNVGRFGFLAEFDADDLLSHAAVIFGPNPPLRSYMMLSASVRDKDGIATGQLLAVNDCVITAGRPFRMIQLGLQINGEEGPTLNGDGVIIATPIGSTAYNVSAGGPIVHPTVEAMSITPLAAHSLAFRSTVIPPESELVIRLERANLGTTLVLDGQQAIPLREQMTVHIARHDRKAKLITNPGRSYWQVLLEKMRWAAPPSYRDRGM